MTSPRSFGTQRDPATADLSVRALIARHKLAAAAAVGTLLITLGLFLVTVLGPAAGSVTDSTSCSQWGSSSQSEQRAYAQHYIGEHGNVAGESTGVSGVEAAINAGCMAAYSSDAEDSITVLDAIEKKY